MDSNFHWGKLSFVIQESFNGKFYLDYHLFVVKEISFLGDYR